MLRAGLLLGLASRVGVLPVEIDGDVVEADRVMLEARFVDGLSRAGFEIVRLPPAACPEPQCVAEVAAAAEVDEVVHARIEKRGRDYQLYAELVAAEDGAEVVAESATCEVCGVEDAADVADGLAVRLRQRRDNASRPERTQPEPEPMRPDPPKKTSRIPRWLPWTMLAVGAASIVTGGVLLGIHGRPIRRDCMPDPNGQCARLHDTLAAGIVFTVAGIGLAGTSIGLAVHRSRKHGDTIAATWSRSF